MAGTGQFCAVARALEQLGGRWTLLIVRELLGGARRFAEIRRGIPRVSRTILSERLQALAAAGVITSTDAGYGLTEAGRELAPLVLGLGTWGQRWLPRDAASEDIDLDPLLLDMTRRLDPATQPATPLALAVALRGHPRRWLLLGAGEPVVCPRNAGFPEPLRIGGPLAALAGWWRGDLPDIAAAHRAGLTLEGPRPLVRAFPTWFRRYLFADVAPALPTPP